MNRRTIEETDCIINAQAAQKILENCRYINQRTLKKWRLYEFCEIIRAGKFISGETILLCTTEEEPDNQQLLDGQHRLQAIVETGMPQRVRLRVDRVGTREEMGELYCLIGTGRRTMADQIKAIKGADGSVGDVRAFGGAVLYAETGFTASGNIRSDAYYYGSHNRVERFERWYAEYDLIKGCLTGASASVRGMFMRSANLAVFMVTARYQPGLTEALINQIGDNDMLAKQSPAWTYLNSLRDKSVHVHRDWAVYSRLVATIWNAHFKGKETIQYLTARSAKKPILLFGTPFNGLIEKPDISCQPDIVAPKAKEVQKVLANYRADDPFPVGPQTARAH